MAFREQALRLILDISSTVITLLVSLKDSHVNMHDMLASQNGVYMKFGLQLVLFFLLKGMTLKPTLQA